MQTLKRGCTGSDVTKLQTALNRAGCSLNVDGVFGAKTEKAVKAFQTTHNLTPDGKVGVLTWEALSPFLDDITLAQAVEACLEAVEKLPEYKRLEALLYG